MIDIAIYGAGGSGREVKIIIDAINKVTPTYYLVGFFDDGKPKGTFINSLPVLGGILELHEINQPLALVISVADPKTRKKIVQGIHSPYITFPNIIHPSVDLSGDFVTLGQGNIMSQGCILTCNIKIHDFLILNLNSTISHDSEIESFCSIMSAVSISGDVKLNQGVYIGVGARIINQIEIGEFAVIGSGAVVTKTIPPLVTAVGIPAKPLSK